MSSWGWGPALILSIGIMLVILGIGALLSELVRKHRANERLLRQAQRSFSVGQDLKDLNS